MYIFFFCFFFETIAYRLKLPIADYGNRIEKREEKYLISSLRFGSCTRHVSSTREERN